MLLTIFFAVLAAFFTVVAEAMFKDSDASIGEHGIIKFVKEHSSSKSWGKAVVIGLVTGAIRYFPMASWLAIICMVATIGLLLYLCHYWHEEGGEWREMVAFVLLAVVVYLAGAKATDLSAVLVKNAFWRSVLAKVPLAVLVGTIGYFLYSLFCYKAERAEEYAEESEEAREDAETFDRWRKITAVLTTIAVVLVFVVGANWSAVNFGKNKAEDPVAEEVVETEPEDEQTAWNYGFYCLNLLQDDDPSNDGNFGWNPYDPNVVGKDYDADLRARMRVDPALGAAVLAWFDVNVGTRYLGQFHDFSNNRADWMTDINAAKEKFMEDGDLYQATLDAFFRYLDSFVREIRVEERTGITDQMYSDPFTVSGVPDIVVRESPDHTGHFLVYKVVIKETGIYEVSFRIECGYQPCNVAEIMHVTPQPAKTVAKAKSSNDSPKSSSGKASGSSKASNGGSASGGRASGGNSSSTGIWYPPSGNPSGGSGGSGSRGGGHSGGGGTTNPKDTSKGTSNAEVGKNSVAGPGSDTNNGVGATKSKEELPTNSSKKESLGGSGNSSYDAVIEQNKEANRTTRISPSNGSSGSKGSSSSGAGTSNTPSSSRSGTDNVDSNAEKGTGNGGIDTPTTKAETHVQTSDGATHSVSNDSPGTSWSGPVD